MFTWPIKVRMCALHCGFLPFFLPFFLCYVNMPYESLKEKNEKTNNSTVHRTCDLTQKNSRIQVTVQQLNATFWIIRSSALLLMLTKLEPPQCAKNGIGIWFFGSSFVMSIIGMKLHANRNYTINRIKITTS